jgi:membrane-bound lytic murein transglycosylase B
VLAVVALAAGIAGQPGPAGGGAARADVPHAQAALDVSAAGRPAWTTAAPGVEHRLTAPTTSAASASQVAARSGVAPASGLAADGIPSTALLAYQRAARREAGRDSACQLTWPLLAGIGRVESDHGRFAGAVLHSDGLSTPPVVGIPLNGNGTAVITDTDGGAIDGDPVYDRAVGPMQFIPSTWAGWGVDANGDGIKDPFNIFDATAAAADYLCAAGGNLATSSGQVAAILSYNWSWDYVRLVMGVEQVYASGGVGITVPVLPTSLGFGRAPGFPVLPPVDPGTPRGTGSQHSASTSPSGRRQPAPGSGGSGSGATGSSSSGRPSSSQSSTAPSSASSSSHPSGTGTSSSSAASTSSSSSASTSSSSGSSASTEPVPSSSSSTPPPSESTTATATDTATTSAGSVPGSSGP